MNIQITKTDCAKIVSGNLLGGGVNTPLEIALAKKCLSLYDRLGEISNERNEYFEALYSASVKFEKATKGRLKLKRSADLARDSKAYFEAAAKLDEELKEMMDGNGKDKD